MKGYVEIGQIYREHGLKGLCKVYAYSLSDEHLQPGQICWLVSEAGEKRRAVLQTIAPSGKFFLASFDCFKGADQILPWRKAKIWIPEADLQREDGEIFDFEWPGYVIFDQTGARIGEILRVERIPLLQFVVRRGAVEVLIPGVQSWILERNPATKTLKMDLPAGLFD